MSEASVSYAALILADAGVEITSDNLLSITKAAGATVDDVWANVYAKALEGRNLKELLFSFAAAPAGGASAGGAAGSSAAVEEAAAEEEEEAEESDDDMGMGLFD